MITIDIDEARLKDLCDMPHNGCDIEDIGIQSDGTFVVFDKCGRFGYLNTDKIKIVEIENDKRQVRKSD